MIKKLSLLLLISVIVVVPVFSGGQAEGKGADKPALLRVGIPESLENPIGQMANEFKRLVEEKSGNKIKVEVYPSMQLGGVREMVESTQMGNQEIVICTPAWASSFVPQISVLSLPYLFKDSETAHRLTDGEIGNELIKYSRDQGFQLLGFPEVGFRQLTNNTRPVTKLEDFRGLKIRLQGDPVHIETFKAFGANPVSLNFAELYSALQQKVVDGQENISTNIFFNKFNEVQKYLSYTNTFYDAWLILMNKDIFEAFSPELQAVIQEAADESVAMQRKLIAEANAEYDRILEDSMISNRIVPAEMERIMEKARSIYPKFNSLIGEELIQKVLAAVE